MKSFQLEGSGLQELSMDEQRQVSGGFGMLLLAALGGLMVMYNIGKVAGEEAYNITH